MLDPELLERDADLLFAQVDLAQRHGWWRRSRRSCGRGFIDIAAEVVADEIGKSSGEALHDHAKAPGAVVTVQVEEHESLLVAQCAKWFDRGNASEVDRKLAGLLQRHGVVACDQ